MELQNSDMTSNLPGQASQRVGWHSLPSELRLMIYQSTWEPRGIEVCTSPHPIDHGPFDLNQRLAHHIRSRFVLPATARLNFEARNITLQHYKPITGDPHYYGQVVNYFNPFLDVVFFDWLPQLSTLPQPPPENIRKLLDILALAEHIVVDSASLFTQLKADLVMNTPAVRNLCPSLQSVDQAKLGCARPRLCRDTRCEEIICCPLPENSGWREHMVYIDTCVVTINSRMVPYRPCREVQDFVECKSIWDRFMPRGDYRIRPKVLRERPHPRINKEEKAIILSRVQ